MKAADKGRTGELIAGLLTLLAIIILMDGMVWQPLSAWAEKFRYEFAASSEPMRSLGMLAVLRRGRPHDAALLPRDRCGRSLRVDPSRTGRDAARSTSAEHPRAAARLALAANRIGRRRALHRHARLIDGIIALMRTLAAAVASRRPADSARDRRSRCCA